MMAIEAKVDLVHRPATCPDAPGHHGFQGLSTMALRPLHAVWQERSVYVRHR